MAPGPGVFSSLVVIVFLGEDTCIGPTCFTVLWPVLGHVHSLGDGDRSES